MPKTAKFQKTADDVNLTDLALDMTQMGLDVVGIFEPTPFADLTNAGISAVRGEWGNAALSVLGVIPYVGDLGKLGKIPKWLSSIEKLTTAVGKLADVAIKGGKKGKEVAEAFIKQVKGLLDKIPLDKVPDAIRDGLSKLKQKVDDFFGQAKKNDNIVKSEKIDEVGKTVDNVKPTKTDGITSPKKPDVEPPKKPDVEPKKTTAKVDKTEPSLKPDKSNKPEGVPEKPKKNMSADNVRSLNRQNESANLLAENGYKVKQLPANSKIQGKKNPDFEIEGKTFDNYAPANSATTARIDSALRKKIDGGQTDRFVLNLNDSKVSLEEMRQQLEKFPIKDLKEIIVIKDGKVIPFYPFSK